MCAGTAERGVRGWKTPSGPDRGHNGGVLFAEFVAFTDRVRALEAVHDKVAETSAFLNSRSPTAVTTIMELLLRTPLMDAPAAAATRRETSIAHEGDQSADTATLTCEQVADSLAQISRTSARTLRRSLTARLLDQATSDERRWIRRAITGIEFDRPTFELILPAAARSAKVSVRELRRAANLCGSLALATRIAFERGQAGLLAVSVEPGRPVPPTVPEISEPTSSLIDRSLPAILEWNVRAERVQVHRADETVTVYDGHLRNMTHRAQSIVEQVVALPGGDLVLDGWAGNQSGIDADADTSGEPSTASVVCPERAALDTVPVLFYDLLYDGESLVNDPLSVRRERLEAIVPASVVVPRLEFADLADVASLLDEATRLGHDGLIRKPLADPYEGGFAVTRWRLVRAVDLPEPIEDSIGDSTIRSSSRERDRTADPEVDEPDPVAALRETSHTARRRSDDSSKPAASEIEMLNERAGSLDREAVLAFHRRKIREQLQDDLVPPALYGIEATRMVMTLIFAALTVVSGWMVLIVVGADVVAGTGDLAEQTVTDLNFARRFFWDLFTAGSAFVPVWLLVLVRKARQAGAEGVPAGGIFTLAGIGVTVCIVGFVFDGIDRGALTRGVAVVVVVGAVSAGLIVERVRGWFGLSAWTLTSWIATLPVILGIAWLAGLAEPVAPSASLQSLRVISMLIALGCARVTVMSFLSWLDLEAKLRDVPELAVPGRRY